MYNRFEFSEFHPIFAASQSDDRAAAGARNVIGAGAALATAPTPTPDRQGQRAAALRLRDIAIRAFWRRTRRQVIAAALHAVAVPRRWAERLRARDELAQLTHRELRDVGLSRYDVEFEIRKPFWRR